MPTFQNYAEAAQAYLDQFRQAAAPPAESFVEAATRGVGEAPAADLITRAAGIADVSRQMTQLAQPLFNSPDLETREGISAQFLSQAAAELQLASELFKTAGVGGVQARALEAAPVTHAVDYAALQQAVNTLEISMADTAQPRLIAAQVGARDVEVKPQTVDQAKQLLVSGVEQNTSAIVARVHELSASIAVDLVLRTDWDLVLKGSKLLGKDVEQGLNALSKSVGATLAKAASSAGQVLLSAYDKILALVGSDPNSPARQQIQTWLNQLRQNQAVNLLNPLIDRLYQVSRLKTQLAGWLEKTDAQVDQLYGASLSINLITGKFNTLGDRITTIEKVVPLVKMLNIPEVLVVVTAIQVGMLAFVVYAGYDYIGYKDPSTKLNVPTLTKGIAEVVQESLGVKS